MHVILSRVKQGDVARLQRYDVGTDALEIWCVTDKNAPVFALNVLGPGEHHLGRATNDCYLVVHAGEMQPAYSKIVGAGERVGIKRGQSMEIYVTDTVIFHREVV